MRCFCCGVTRQNRLTVAAFALKRLFAQPCDLVPGEHAVDRNADLGADMAGDALVVAAQNLYLDARLRQRAHRVGGIAFRRIDEEREACEGELIFVAFGDRVALHRARRDAEHAITLFAQLLEVLEQLLP